MYFKTWKKKRKHLFGALQITSTHILTLIRKKEKKITRPLLIVSSVPENDFWNLVSLTTLLQIPLFYTHDLHICLAFSRTLPFSLFLHLYQIYLSIYYISLLYILPPALQYFMVFIFTLCTFLGRPVAKESRMLTQLKK